jgi:hypothetical protein
MMHPSEASLALFAGGDLGAFSAWRTQRHIQHCGECRRAVEEFAALRSKVPELGQLPGVQWNRLAAEMKANIRLGLAAGECVRGAGWTATWQPKRLPGNAFAYAGVLALMLAGIWLQRPAPGLAQLENPDAVTLESTRNGIELKQGGQMLSLMHKRAADVNYSVSTQGVMSTRYIDSDTGYVTINKVYAQ